MRHHLKFEVRGNTAHEIQALAESAARQFFGPDVEIVPGSVYIDTTPDYEHDTWVGKVSVDVRERRQQPARKFGSAHTRLEVFGETLTGIVEDIDAQLTHLYGGEEFTYSIEIEMADGCWKAGVSAWLGSNDMGDF